MKIENLTLEEYHEEYQKFRLDTKAIISNVIDEGLSVPNPIHTKISRAIVEMASSRCRENKKEYQAIVDAVLKDFEGSGDKNRIHWFAVTFELMIKNVNGWDWNAVLTRISCIYVIVDASKNNLNIELIRTMERILTEYINDRGFHEIFENGGWNGFMDYFQKASDYKKIRETGDWLTGKIPIMLVAMTIFVCFLWRN